MSIQQQGPLTINTDVYGEATHCDCYGVEWCYFGDGVDAYVKFSDLDKITDEAWTLIETWDMPAETPQDRFRRDKKPGWIYILEGGGYYKIGQSINPDRRIKQISPVLPFDVTIYHTYPAENVDYEEAMLHQMFHDCRANGEWFHLTEEDLAWLKTL